MSLETPVINKEIVFISEEKHVGSVAILVVG